MGFSYLEDNKWEDISRSERLFCSHLYWVIKNDIKRFIRYINGNLNKGRENKRLDENENWDVSIEVAFYRDMFAKFAKSEEPITKTNYPRSRIFDLCLFSEKKIVVIEAKAQRGMANDQARRFEEDKERIKKVIRRFSANNHDDLEVLLVVLCSSKDTITKKHKEPVVKRSFWFGAPQM